MRDLKEKSWRGPERGGYSVDNFERFESTVLGLLFEHVPRGYKHRRHIFFLVSDRVDESAAGNRDCH
jgi:hypothetical protein